VDNTEKQDELIEFGSVTEATKGFFPHGFFYDGGAGYYQPDTDPYYP
jgi:hypothetical protein